MHLFLRAIFTLIIFSSFAFGQATFVGSSTCSGCHSSKYNDWVASGHPYKFSVIENDMAPTYPAEAINFQDTWMDSLGDGSHTWADIAGVIGGYGWKARFVGSDGHLIGTAGSSFGDAGGGHNQFNFYGGEEHGWVNYHPADTKIYNYGCFKCHTTGGDTSGTWLEGVEGLGTFSEGGVGCESCHGPGSDHIVGPSKSNIDKVYEFAHLDNAIGGLVYADGDTMRPDVEGNDVNFLCGTCHNRSYTYPINSSSGFVKHHEQWDEFLSTDHFEAGFTCITCHDPHKRVIWDGDGITKTCETCHSDKAATINHSASATCIDCHMPFAAKSGTTRGNSGFKGDVRSHIMTIIPDTSSMFKTDGSAVKDDMDREAGLSPRQACLSCHNDASDDGISDKTLELAALQAVDMHEATAIAGEDNNVPSEFVLKQNYPNPFNPSTTIEYSLPTATHVTLTVFDLSGQTIATIQDADLPAGVQSVQFSPENLPSGVYFYRINTDDHSSIKRMTYIK